MEGRALRALCRCEVVNSASKSSTLQCGARLRFRNKAVRLLATGTRARTPVRAAPLAIHAPGWKAGPLLHIRCSFRNRAHRNETGASGGKRQNAERLRLFPHKTDGPRLSSRVHTAVNAETDARTRRVRGEIHDRLSERIPRELVQMRQALTGSGAGVTKFFRRQRLATSVGMAAQRMDSSR
jgi:hypothetical protein